MPKVILYHNPRCRKSRQALALLQQHGITPEIIEYLEKPPSKSQLKRILKMLQYKPRELMRRKEPLYRQLALDNPALTQEELVNAMVANPTLIERPIVVVGERAALGRPPENIVEIL